jgi:phage terminase large subunit-like protein
VGLIKGNRSEAQRFSALPPAEKKKLIRRLSDDDLEALLYDWKFWARPEQLPPGGDWTTWAIIAGRGSGKTRSAAEFVRDEIQSGRSQYPILIGADAEEVRKVMVQGESGMLAVCPPWFTPKYEPSKKQLVFPNGVIANLYGAHEPNKLRGPQSDLVWADEIAKWKYAQDAYDNAVLGNRLGDHPRRVVTTTPKPIALVRKLMGRDPSQRGRPKDTSVVLAPQMSTYDNMANLAASFIKEVFGKYQGTRLGRQELMGELLMDVPGALWTLAMIEEDRVHVEQCPEPGDFVRIVVAIDPAVTSGEDSNETGIICAGRTFDEQYYVLRDRSGHHPSISVNPRIPSWARIAVDLFHEQRADRIVAEVNNGGDLVEAQLRIVEKTIPYTPVHASRGKRTRGEPVAALYEQHKVHHVGSFDALEDQMIVWVPDAGDESPDRVVALVWALTELSDIFDPGELPPTSSERSY